MILAALSEGKTPAEIAQYYADSFHRDEAKANIKPGHHFPWATQHVPEMISIVEQLLAKGYAYQAGDNIYFDVAKFPDYGKLSGNVQEGLMDGVRSEVTLSRKTPEISPCGKWRNPEGK